MQNWWLCAVGLGMPELLCYAARLGLSTDHKFVVEGLLSFVGTLEYLNAAKVSVYFGAVIFDSGGD